MVRNIMIFSAIIHTYTPRLNGHSYLTTCGLSTRLGIFVAEIAAASALTYSPRPIRRLPLKPITIDDIVVRTVPMTDAITFTPHNNVMSSLIGCLFCECNKDPDAILVMEGNWKPMRRPAGDKSAKVSAILSYIGKTMLRPIMF